MRRLHNLRPRFRDYLSASPEPATQIMPFGFWNNRAVHFRPEPHGAFRRLASPEVHPAARLPLARQTFRRGASYAFEYVMPEKPLPAAFGAAAREPLEEDRVSPRLVRAVVPHRADPLSCFNTAVAVTPVQDRIPSRFCGDGSRRPLRVPAVA